MRFAISIIFCVGFFFRWNELNDTEMLNKSSVIAGFTLSAFIFILTQFFLTALGGGGA